MKPLRTILDNPNLELVKINKASCYHLESHLNLKPVTSLDGYYFTFKIVKISLEARLNDNIVEAFIVQVNFHAFTLSYDFCIYAKQMAAEALEEEEVAALEGEEEEVVLVVEE